MIKKNMKVLLADDDAKDQSRFQIALAGYSNDVKIETVANGMQLLDHLIRIHKSPSFLSSHLPDLIITDLYMPFAGGLQVLKQIRNHPEFSHIPIYVFSANFDTTIRTKVMENGATEFNQKPTEFTALQNIISTILDKKFIEITA